MNMKKAFTLAEVLITLGVIGVVASMTMPSLINKYRERQTISAVKVAYSIFSQAYLFVVNEYDSLDNLVDSTKSDKENAQTMFNELSKYIKKIKSCDNDDNCMGNIYKTLDGRTMTRAWDDFGNVETGILANGMSFFIVSTIRSDGKYNGQIGVDINGQKGPNQLGVDFFHFYIVNTGQVYPNCSRACKELLQVSNRFSQCSINSSSSIYNGYACTSWILEHENMEYLKRDISNEE